MMKPNHPVLETMQIKWFKTKELFSVHVCAQIININAFVMLTVMTYDVF